MSDHTRRALLGAAATGVVTGLAGCFGLGGGFGGGCTSQYTLELRRVEDSGLQAAVLADAPPDRVEVWRDLIDTAASESEAMLTTIYGTPVRGGSLVEAGGAYHETSVEVTATESVAAHVFGLEYEQGVPAPDDATVVAYADLPAVDRAAFDTAVRDAKRGRFEEAASVSIGGFEYVYRDDAERESRFVAESPVWVRYEDVEVEVRVTGTRQVDRETFRVTLERVAETTVEFLEYVRANHIADLAGLSEAEADVVREATEEEYEECEPLSEGFQSVVDSLRSLPDTYRPDRNLLVEFEEETYVADLLHAVA